MLTLNDLTDDQNDFIDRLYEYDETLGYAVMGSGKTVCYLTAFKQLKEDGVINRGVLFAPLKPAMYVWPYESDEWSHLDGLNVVHAYGTADKRSKVIEDASVDLVVINVESMAWFFDTYDKKQLTALGFDAMCIDELSKFGTVGNKATKALRRNLKLFKHRVGLTGTPVHEGFEKLYSQVLMIDGGKRLGTSKDRFLNEFFITSFSGYDHSLKDGADAKILERLNGLLYAVPDYTHLLPAITERRIDCALWSPCAEKYAEMEKHSVVEIDCIDDDEHPIVLQIVADNAGAQSGKLEQLANGFIYDDEKVAIPLGDHKENALINFLGSENWGRGNGGLLLFYQFEYDRDLIKSALTKLGITYTTLDAKNGLESFLAGKVDVLLLHPKSAGHGLNLQVGGCHNILCYSPIWSNDQYRQLVARVWRRGQSHDVNVWSIVARGTIDELKLERVEDKAENDKAFKRFIAAKNKAG